MNHYRKKHYKSFFNRDIISSYLPNKNDNLNQILLKVFYLLTIVLLLFSICFVSSVFLKIDKQESIIEDSRNIWHNYRLSSNYSDATKLDQISDILSTQNPDYSGWITIKNSKIDNPIYKTCNNSYYIENNQNKEPGFYGALHFDYRCKINENNTDKNLIIYGKNIYNGSMFGELQKLKNIDYYKNHSLIDFSTKYESATYKIFAVFILNSKKEDDGGNIFNIYRKNFFNSADFSVWINDAFERSIFDSEP